MKIKTVCEITGLTSRTVRVYIDEKLINPTFTENYLGRRNFDFSDDDITALKNIAILRKFDFSIDEIRDMINNSEKSIAIIQDVKDRTEKQVLEGQERLDALSRIEANRAYSVAELAENLSGVSPKLPPQSEPFQIDATTVLKSIIKAAVAFIAVWSPFAFCLPGLLIGLAEFAYPALSLKAIGLTLISFIPSIVIIVISKTKVNCKRLIKRVLFVLCIFCIPISFVMSCCIVTHSQTDDIRNYRRFDADCLANRNTVFQELFPIWPHYFENVEQADGHYETVYLDAKYHYYYFQGFDYTYDIYAEWPLEKDEFAQEVQRVKAIFDKPPAYNYQFAEYKKGNFTCWILYSGAEPFQPATGSYSYLIFAYDENRSVVRYISCDSLENGADQPYYLQLDW